MSGKKKRGGKQTTPAKAPEIQGFKSIATFDAATAKEGQVTTHVFEGWPIRRIIHNGQPWFSLVDMIAALTESDNPPVYWRQLKRRLLEEGADEAVTKCNALRLPTAGGMQATDCANIETLNRLVQSIPSPKVEPWKQWLAQVGFERIEETADPGRAVKRAVQTYRDQGRPDDWIDNRLQQAAAEGALESEWDKRGVTEKGAPVIRKAMHKETFGVTPQAHREIKRLREDRVDLPDHMTGLELALDRLGKEAAKEFCVEENTTTQKATHASSVKGAKIAGNARKQIEKQTKKSVVSSHNFLPKPDMDKSAS